jgi:1,2-phenylacetyl-CoA epoxidase catalytic subunit
VTVPTQQRPPQTTDPQPGPQAARPQIAMEADLDRAPDLLEGARTLELTPQQCTLEYWLANVAQGTLRGMVNGHAPAAVTPDWMRQPGPLRQALVEEFAFRSIAEEKATRALSYLVAHAPDLEGMEFFATPLIDEARHSSVFRGHLLELGVPREELLETIERVAGEDRDRVLVPLEEFGLPLGERADYIGGVIVLTVLVEGVLAPAAELSERKWRILDPAAAEIERAAGVDEIRHLTVGSAVVKQHLERNPADLPRLQELIDRGRSLWGGLPVLDVILRREMLFQEGLQAMAGVVGDYEIWPGRRLLDTTAEERLMTAATWSLEMQESRLAYMGLA